MTLKELYQGLEDWGQMTVAVIHIKNGVKWVVTIVKQTCFVVGFGSSSLYYCYMTIVIWMSYENFIVILKTTDVNFKTLNQTFNHL